MQKSLKSNNKNIKIRLANSKDILFTLNLYNENIMKKRFFSNKIVDLKDHKIWFANKIKDKTIFICSQRTRIGYVRYDYLEKKTISISIAVKEKYKKKGFGKLMLARTLKNKRIKKYNVIAKIRKDNCVSTQFFLNSGFKFLKKNVYVYKKR